MMQKNYFHLIIFFSVCQLWACSGFSRRHSAVGVHRPTTGKSFFFFLNIITILKILLIFLKIHQFQLIKPFGSFSTSHKYCLKGRNVFLEFCYRRPVYNMLGLFKWLQHACYSNALLHNKCLSTALNNICKVDNLFNVWWTSFTCWMGCSIFYFFHLKGFNSLSFSKHKSP